MLTLYTGGKELEITYSNGDIVPFDSIIGIIYLPGGLTIVWNDYTTKTIDSPADIYRHIACKGCFELDIE